MIHLAASISVAESMRRPLEYWRNNALGSLDADRDRRSSTACAPSCSRRRRRSTATPSSSRSRTRAPLAPINPYGASKAAVEQMLADVERAHGMRWARAPLLQRVRRGSGRGARRVPRARDAPDPGRARGGGRAAPRARALRHRLPDAATAPASATTSTSPTSPTPTCAPSRRCSRTGPAAPTTSGAGTGRSNREVLDARRRDRRAARSR